MANLKASFGGKHGPLFIPISGHTAQECHLHLTLALNVTHKIVPHTSVGRWVGTDVPTYVYNFTYLYLMCLKSIPHSSYLYLSHSFSFTMYTNKHTLSLSLPHKSTHFNSHPLLHVYHNMELLVKEESLACHKTSPFNNKLGYFFSKIWPFKTTHLFVER